LIAGIKKKKKVFISNLGQKLEALLSYRRDGGDYNLKINYQRGILVMELNEKLVLKTEYI
jgi:hypothetical protein